MTKAYDQFIAEPVTYTICRYGDSTALGIKGPKAAVQKVINMFLNLDAPRRVTWTSETFAYISASLPRIKAVVKLHLYLQIMMNREVTVTESWDDESGEYSIQQDEKAANDLAEMDAHHFLTTLQTESFIAARQYA